MFLAFGKWDIRARFSALAPWREIRLYRERHEGSYHLVWGRLSVVVEDGELDIVPLCRQCDSPEVGEVFAGTEGLTVCRECSTVEGGYQYVSRREANN